MLNDAGVSRRSNTIKHKENNYTTVRIDIIVNVSDTVNDTIDSHDATNKTDKMKEKRHTEYD